MPRFSFVVGLALIGSLALARPNAPFAEPAASPGRAPVHGMPKILAVELPADRSFYAGQTVHSSVLTTPNVNYVEARIRYRNAPMHQDGAGRFSLDYTIPWWLPPWLRHTWTVEFIARSVDGVEVKEAFPIRVR